MQHQGRGHRSPPMECLLQRTPPRALLLWAILVLYYLQSATVCLFFYAFLTLPYWEGIGKEKYFEKYFDYLEVLLFKLQLKASYTSSSRP